MDIDLLTSSMIYKDIFKNIPKIYESYENYLKISKDQLINQIPFKTLIKKYKEVQHSLLFKYETSSSLMSDSTYKYQNHYPELYNTELSFFSGITKCQGFNCFTYYDIKNERLFYVEPSSNEEFINTFFIQTNENILDNITIKNKNWKQNFDLEEYFCINKNKYEKMKVYKKEK